LTEANLKNINQELFYYNSNILHLPIDLLLDHYKKITLSILYLLEKEGLSQKQKKDMLGIDHRNPDERNAFYEFLNNEIKKIDNNLNEIQEIDNNTARYLKGLAIVKKENFNKIISAIKKINEDEMTQSVDEISPNPINIMARPSPIEIIPSDTFQIPSQSISVDEESVRPSGCCVPKFFINFVNLMRKKINILRGRSQ